MHDHIVSFWKKFRRDKKQKKKKTANVSWIKKKIIKKYNPAKIYHYTVHNIGMYKNRKPIFEVSSCEGFPFYTLITTK